MAMTRKPALKASKRIAAKKVAGRTIRRRSTVSGRATLKTQQTQRAAKKGTRVALKAYHNPNNVEWSYLGRGNWAVVVRDSRGKYKDIQVQMPRMAPKNKR